MHVALVTHSLPQPSTTGGPMTCWAIMRQLRDDGHRVTVISLRQITGNVLHTDDA